MDLRIWIQWKVSHFVEHELSRKRDSKLDSNITQRKGCFSSTGWHQQCWSMYSKMWTFLPVFFFWRVSYFSEPRWTTHRQILQATQRNAYLSTDTQKQALLCCMRPLTLREGSPKATNWSGIKNGKSSKEVKLSRYQSIDEKHFWVCVKFEVGLFILFTKKMSSKKVRLFSLSFFFKWRGSKIKKTWTMMQDSYNRPKLRVIFNL
jgi:hypothetical protein